MSELTLFSVLIANYNNGCFLQDAIDSVKAQSYKNWEIVIVDDASTDNSKDMYSKYANDSRIKVFFNDKNEGCGFTKRKCAELATGELCGFLDPDDTLTTDALEVMVNEHSRKTDAALICSRHIFCDENMNAKWESEPRSKSSFNYLTDRFHAIEHFAVFKTELYRKSEGLNQTFQRAVDQDLIYLLEEQGDIVLIDNALYNYRLHNNSLSIGHYKAMYWRVLAIEAACKRRGLSAEEVVGNMFSGIIKKHEDNYEKIKNSDYYKLGFKILSPFHKVTRKIKKLLK